MANNKGLGRGYASLLGMNDVDLDEKIAPKKVTELGEQPTEIELNEIDPNYEQPRKVFNEESLRELADSIKQHGVIQPIILTKVGARFMIIAGERRFRASKLAGFNTIPAIVRHYTPQQIREVSLVENLQRDDLNPIEAARAIKELIDSYNLTQESVADRLGKSRPAIANTLRLLSLDAKVLKFIEEGRLSAGHGRALVVVARPADQIKLAELACDNKMNVRQTEKAVRELNNPKPTKEVASISLELKDLVDNMQRAFATKVSAIGSDDKGRIHIDYYTKDDLDRICLLIKDWLNKQKTN
ncbi:MAG: ParB/RepB/Spo0J family partition protein [Clostridia bacterium]